MAQQRTSPLARLVLYVLGAAFSAIIGVYVAKYLEGRVLLTHYYGTDLYASTGRYEIDTNLDLDVSHVYYRDVEYNALRVVHFHIANESSRNLRGDAQFVFLRSDDQPVPLEAVVDIWCDCQLRPSTGTLVAIERQDVPNLAPGFRLLSDLPGSTQIGVAIVLDTSVDSSLQDAEITVIKLARQGERLEPLTAENTITISVFAYVLSLVAAGASYTLFITIVNLRMGHYGWGSRLIDRISVRLIGREIMRPLVKGDWSYQPPARE